MQDYTQYEKIVKELLDAEIKAELNPKNYQIFHNKKYEGKSGQLHQIDVAIEAKIAGIEILIIVECKHYNKKISMNEILVFTARIDDISAHKGIMVTTIGFQSGVEKIARAKKIALVVVKDLIWRPYMGDPVMPAFHFKMLVKYLSWALNRRIVLNKLMNAYDNPFNSVCNYTDIIPLGTVESGRLNVDIKGYCTGFILTNGNVEIPLHKNELFSFLLFELLLKRKFNL
jgi:hypothetical protein